MKNTLIDVVAIVDGASTSAHLAPAFRACNVKCVHVMSSPALPERLKQQIIATDYIANIVHRGNIEETARELREMGVSVILPGVDSGVELASLLAEKMQLTWSNPVGLTRARRDKFEQIETIRRAGLLAPEQYLAQTPEAIVQWASQYGRFPVVVKPVRSSGVKGVKVCRTPEEVRLAANTILSSTSSYDEAQEDILIQSYSQGQEYIVDSVSFAGEHRIISLWQVERDHTMTPRLEIMQVIDHGEEQYAPILDYARQVLDATGMHYGPAHLELIVTESGPTIVELNCRLHGSLDPRLTSAACGVNQVNAVVEAFINPAHFSATLDVSPSFYGYCGHVLLLSPGEGTLSREFAWDKIEALPSCVSVKRWIKVGDRLTKTVDLRTALGAAGLFHPCAEQIRKDWQAIRGIENAFFAAEDD